MQVPAPDMAAIAAEAVAPVPKMSASATEAVPNILETVKSLELLSFWIIFVCRAVRQSGRL